MADKRYNRFGKPDPKGNYNKVKGKLVRRGGGGREGPPTFEGAGKGGKAVIGYKKGETPPSKLTAAGFGHPGTRRVTPGYREGDEWKFANRPPQEFTGIQQALIDAGYADKLRIGTWDGASASAYKELLSDANRQGTSAQEALGAAVEGAAAGGMGGGGGKQGQVINKPNLVTGGEAYAVSAKEDLQAAMRSTFNDLLAMDPSSAEEMVFIADQRAKEIWQQAVPAAQQQKKQEVDYWQQMADVNKAEAGQGALEAGQNVVTGGQVANIENKVVEQAPSPQAAAEMIARTKYPERYGVFQINKRLEDVMSSLQSTPNAGVRPLAR